MTSEKRWTPPKLVKWITDDFSDRGLPGLLRLEAERLVSHALKISRLDIYLQFDKPCTQEEQAIVRELVIRRRDHEPLSYIMKSSEFRSLSLDVGPGVLIPRPETELLVEAVLEIIRIPERVSPLQILELGTGSGAIPLALSMEDGPLMITATEISDQALSFARRNVNRYRQELEQGGSQILLIRGDRFEAIRKRPAYDCIVSNPPYITSTDIQDLQEEVRQWEPENALDGGDDGLDFYRYLTNAADSLLKKGGFLVCEHGFDQRELILEMATDSLKPFNSIKDYAGLDRIQIFQKTGS